MTVTFEQIVALPKVVLHDHLDGGVRAATVVDLAAQAGHTLPTTDVDALADWFHQQATSGSLEAYIDTFVHTAGVMQTADALRRVAREAVEDLAADGVVYAEERFAPELHQSGGLSLQQAVDAVLEGLRAGEESAAAQGRTIRTGLLVCAMRQSDRADEVAALVLANRDRGVVGFDIAGPESGFPASALGAAFAQLRAARMPVTVHAGEAAGAESVDQAVDVGALRLGHGVRLVDDVHVPDDGGEPRLGRLAHWVRDRRIALEVCPSSNLQTGAATSVATHPVTTLLRLGFAVTVNTDNRLQSRTSLSRELHLLVTEAGWTLDDVRTVTLTAARHAFVHEDERQHLIDRVILPGHAPTGTGRHRA
ncbi:adenosine deaminase [Cellulomonas triticagri]|uniref:adenosine deaminase n=1 Tax=Cellulomonas triticagri TaxID=2483352 RepID=A0A3M2JC03_9CELL|nr:adenosine deaminase [Cellulomonas triticagri]RMI09043.1 adenosine deaminase [Cellulomonas triticagri]